MTTSTLFEITWICRGLFADASVLFKWEIVGGRQPSAVFYIGNLGWRVSRVMCVMQFMCGTLGAYRTAATMIFEEPLCVIFVLDSTHLFNLLLLITV